MTTYPSKIDDDSTIVRVDDNLSEIGGHVINQIRSAVFAIEKELGITPSGTLSSVSDRLNVSLNPNGTIKSSALVSVGLATLPITNNHVASNAGILESKLTLDFSTSDLHSLLQTNKSNITSLVSFASTLESDLLTHIAGGEVLSDGNTLARHVASHIDLNSTPSDPRDPFFMWPGLLDKDGNARSATTVAEALLEINDDFTSHQNNNSGEAHFASGISVDTDDFNQIPKSANTVQKAFQSIDDINSLIIGKHQANLHSSGIPKKARNELLNIDGYSDNIIPPTPATAFLVMPPSSNPVDSNSTGDDIISFVPDNSGFLFDNQFSAISVGDIVRINYGNGIEAVFTVESKRHIPGVEWVIRINGKNLCNTNTGEAVVRVDKSPFIRNTYGVLAVAAANNDIDPNIMGSVIVGDARAANALGLGFDPSQLDSSHYNLYLNLYPTGNPNDAVVAMPAIDVTGNQGTTPGKYTVKSVVQTVNNKFRSAGYNLRFIAYEHDGNFGIMLADSINNAAFSIINGTVSGASLVTGSFTNNVIGDATDGKDALGFGRTKAGIASPDFTNSFSSEGVASNFATIILSPGRNKDYIVSGNSKDSFESTYLANKDGYWDGYISARTAVGATTVEITYQVDMDLSSAGLMPGKTIVVQPAVDLDSFQYNDFDYGRFIIKSVQFSDPCGVENAVTSITVINGRHATGLPIGSTAFPPLPVRLYFSYDSVGFNQFNVIDAGAPANDFIRYHEIFIDKYGKTFSHERARLIKQNESSELLRTSTNWTLNYVSPKLRGYRDSSSSNFNKYIRFYVLNYDSGSGEFDGYIGKREFGTPNIEKTGKIVRGRKNISTKFYDESGIDYIELEYFDTNPSPGLDILSTNVPRYVDIEIFPSLATNQEFIRLAGCVVNDTTVSNVLDLREFGNVSEEDLSSSAISFIESGDRALHENGIIYGLDFIAEDSAIDGLLHFKGGQALVNGHISMVNEQSISIPEIILDDPEQNTLDWAICVNEHNALEVILLRDDKEQSFVKVISGATNYYIPSVTFLELINDRKDLTPIYIANVTIASLTLNSINDCRKFINSETKNITLTLFGNSGGFNNIRGHFSTFEQLKTWVNRTGTTTDNFVKIRGSFVVNDTIDLTDMTSPLVLDGDGGNSITINAATGFLIKDNIKLKNLNFNYEANIGGLLSESNIHVNVNAGCIVVDASESAENIEITGCTFNRTEESARPPFINARIDMGGVLKNCYIEKNKFYSVGSNTINGAIAIVSTLSGDSEVSAAAIGVKVNDNYLDNQQCILMVVNSGDATPTSALYTSNCIIKNNKLENGLIGFNISSDYISNDFRNSLIIDGNEANGICVLSGNGKLINSIGYNVFGTGNIIISNNICSIIRAVMFYNAPSYKTSSLLIKNNILRAHTNADAIVIDSGFTASTGPAVPCVQIIGNDIDRTEDYLYFNGINTNVPCIVSGNYIKGFTNSAIVKSIRTTNAQGCTTITNNHLYRLNQSLGDFGAYVFVALNDDFSNCIVTDNFFDSPTTNGTNTNIISVYGSSTAGSIVERNINQTVVLNVAHSVGDIGVRNIIGNYPAPSGFQDSIIVYSGRNDTGALTGDLGSISRGRNNTLISQRPTPSENVRSFDWMISLADILPRNVKIISITCGFTSNSATATNVTGQLGVFSYTDTSQTSVATSPVVNASTVGTPVTATISDTIALYTSNNLFLRATLAFSNSSTTETASANIHNLIITYRY